VPDWPSSRVQVDSFKPTVTVAGSSMNFILFRRVSIIDVFVLLNPIHLARLFAYSQLHSEEAAAILQQPDGPLSRTCLS
jgi:hypothetical protein